MLKRPGLTSADWDYRTANTKEYTHGIHPYPAMMIPQVARRLIRTFADAGDTFERNIPNKRMPSMNSPSNTRGKLGKTMKREHVIVCRKREYFEDDHPWR